MTNFTSSLNSVISSSSINNILANEYGIYCLAGVKAYCRQTAINAIIEESGISLIDSVVDIERKSMNQRLAAAAKLHERYLERAEKDFENRECHLGANVSAISEESAKINYDRNLRYYEKAYHNSVSEILSGHDLAVKIRYARTVALSLPLSDFERNLFMELRLAKAWNFTETVPCIELSEVVKAYLGEGLSTDRHPGGAYYKVTFRSVAELAAKGLTLAQIERFLKEVGYMQDRYKEDGRCMSTNNCTFAGGLHFGTWFARTVHGINRSHVRDFARFMRVFSFTKFISPKLSHRQLCKLDGLDKKELKMTVTDRRNWTVHNSRDNRGFRLTAIVRSVSDWQPIRKNHLVDREWLTMAGRIPANREVYNLPVEVIKAFTKKTFGKFIKELIELGLEGEHNVLSLAKIHTCLGAGWKTYFGPKQSWDYFLVATKEDVVVNVHDIGINLPPTMGDDQRRFFKNNSHNHDQACLVVRSWELLLKEGVNPLAKEGLKKATAFLASLVYERCEDIHFAQECAKWGLSQIDFEKVQKAWTGRDIRYETIPKVSISDGDFKFYKLDRDDTRGPFLGEYTGCCQHPQGAGASCAIHGTTNPDGGFVVLEYRGEIKFQSWVWRSGNTLVFDNIEGGCSSDIMDTARELYLKGIQSFMGKLCVDRLFVGTGGSDIRFDLPILSRPCPAPSGYNDSNTVWEVK